MHLHTRTSVHFPAWLIFCLSSPPEQALLLPPATQRYTSRARLSTRQEAKACTSSRRAAAAYAAVWLLAALRASPSRAGASARLFITAYVISAFSDTYCSMVAARGATGSASMQPLVLIGAGSACAFARCPLRLKLQAIFSMADHQDAGPEYKVFVGGISWQMDDTALMKGAGLDLAI